MRRNLVGEIIFSVIQSVFWWAEFVSDMSSVCSLLIVSSLLNVECSIPALLMLPNSKESQDWIRNTKRGQLFRVLELGSKSPGKENENTQYSDYETEKMQGPTPLSLLYQSWFLKRQEREEKQEMQTTEQTARAKVTKLTHNGHQPNPKLQGQNTKHTNYGNNNLFSKPIQHPISLPQHVETPTRFYHKTLTSYEEIKDQVCLSSSLSYSPDSWSWLCRPWPRILGPSSGAYLEIKDDC